jgi:hypothetical protein
VSMAERRSIYLEIDSDRIRADTPAEFRQLLDYIRVRAGLTSSQIAIKTAIPRSQAYNMVAATRTSLPSKPDQVREFVSACGLAPVQVGLVMDLWGKLDQQAREQAAVRASSLVHGLTASEEVASSRRLFEDGSRPRRKRIAQDTRRPATASDLLFLILDDPHRTRRALQLLIPIALAFVAIVTAFVVWAILQPNRTSMIVPILGAVILLPLMSLKQLVRR